MRLTGAKPRGGQRNATVAHNRLRREGAAAREAGTPLDACPHTKGKDQFWWKRGWLEAAPVVSA